MKAASASSGRSSSPSVAPQLAAAEAKPGIRRRGGAERRSGALHVVAAQPQFAQLEVRRRPVGCGGHRLGGQRGGVVQVVRLHARTGHGQQAGREPGRVECRAGGGQPRGGRGIAKCRGQRPEGGRRAGRRSSRRHAVGRRRGAPPDATARAAPPLPARARLSERRSAVATSATSRRGSSASEPHLQHVERLGRDQPRAVGLRVLEGEVQVGHPDHGIGGPLVRRDDRMDERPVARRRRFHQRTIAASRSGAAPRRRAGPGTRAVSATATTTRASRGPGQGSPCGSRASRRSARVRAATGDRSHSL